eukprot:TRINITY_DN11635_c0_g1_i1.p2 TRINITY_DN11635_c0_g1~~TRINITY_DN11635_c0_g1_i1.p2  ORF type:complete len:708 (-),score=245.36 TRINITY_DN11635_c0_g1_i1:2395-4518(-)
MEQEGRRTTEPLADGGLAATLVLGLLVCSIAWLVYLLIRRCFPRVYFPKDEGNESQKTLLGWAPWVFLMTDKSVLLMHGPRALAFLSWSRCWFFYLFLMAITSMPLLLVLNVLYTDATGPFAKTVTAFLPLDDPITWVSFVVSIWALLCLFVVFVYHVLYVLHLRMRMKNSRTFVNATLKVTGIGTKEADPAVVSQKLSTVGVTPEEVNIAFDDDKLLELQEKRREHEDKVEELREYGEPTETRPPRFKLPGILTCNGKVNELEWNEAELAKTREKIEARLQKKAGKLKCTNVAFATYKSVEDAQVVVRDWHTSEESGCGCCGMTVTGMMVRPAHAPDEVHWGSLAKLRPRRTPPMFVFNVCTAILAVIFTIPITFLASLELWINFPGIGPVVGAVLGVSDVLAGLLTKTLPAVLQAIFFVLLPIVLTFMAKLEHHHSFSSSEASVSLKMYIFTLLNNVILFMLFVRAIDVFNQVEGGFVVAHADALRTLDWGIYASYYCTWLLVYGLISSSLSVLNPVGLIVQWIKLKLAKTPKAKRLATELSPYRFSLAYAKQGMTVAVVLMFVPIAPVVVAAGFVCTGMWLIADRINMTLVQKPAGMFDLKGTALFYGFLFVAIVWSQVTWVFFFATHGPATIAVFGIFTYIAYDLLLLVLALFLYFAIKIVDRRTAGQRIEEDLAEFVACGGSEAEHIQPEYQNYHWPGSRPL